MTSSERLDERIRRLTERALRDGKVVEAVSSADLEAVNSFWEMLGDENFLRSILASDPLGRNRLKIILSPASWRVDKPGMREPEEIVLTVSSEDGKLGFMVTCHLEIDTGSDEFIRTAQLYLINSIRGAERWASNAYKGEYQIDKVSNSKRIDSVGFAVKLYRVVDAEKLARSHPGAVGGWLTAIEGFLGQSRGEGEDNHKDRESRES